MSKEAPVIFFAHSTFLCGIDLSTVVVRNDGSSKKCAYTIFLNLQMMSLRIADLRTAIILLNGKNYLTWKVQCRMALVKDSLWGIVSSTESTPGENTAA